MLLELGLVRDYAEKRKLINPVMPGQFITLLRGSQTTLTFKRPSSYNKYLFVKCRADLAFETQVLICTSEFVFKVCAVYL